MGYTPEWKAGAEHILTYMHVSQQTLETLGVIVQLPKTRPNEIQKIEIVYGNITSDFHGKVTHAERTPLVIRARVHMQGSFTDREHLLVTRANKENNAQALEAFCKEVQIWGDAKQVVQYSSWSYELGDGEGNDLKPLGIAFTIKRP